MCFLYPCSLGIRGFESHPPHLCINYRFILRKDDITRTKELDILEIGIRTAALQFRDSKHSIGHKIVHWTFEPEKALRNMTRVY